MSDYQAVKDGIENVFSLSSRFAQEAIQILENSYNRPSAVYRPVLSLYDGKWFALYGEDNKTGCVGTGDSPDAAMWDFDKNWHKKVGEA